MAAQSDSIFKKLNILCVGANFDPVTGGGEAERSFQLAKYLSLQGHDCHVLTLQTRLSDERKESLGKVSLTFLPILLQRFKIPRFSWKTIRQFVREADAIHMMGHWSFINALVYLAAQRENKPYVVCPAGSLIIYGRSQLFKKFYNFIIGNQLIQNAKVCIAITEKEIEQFIPYSVPRAKIQVIPNGISASDFQIKNEDSFRQKYNLVQKPFVIFLGRLNLIKGPDLLLQAFIKLKNQFPEQHLVFVGPDGGMLSELKALAETHQISERVHFIGYLGGAEKSSALHAADLLTVSSRHEAMSIVALEAGACDTPVLLTDQCGFNQLATIGAAWVKPASIEGLSEGLIEALSNTEARKLAAARIRDFVMKNYDWNIVIQKYSELFKN